MARNPLLKRQTGTVRCSGDVLKWLGLACIIMGTFSMSVLQRGVLRLGEQTSQSLYDMIKPGGDMFGWASAAVALSLFSAVAIPIYAKLLYEGWKHTSNMRAYLARLLGMAVLCEIPYDLAASGRWMDISTQNPIWVLAIALVMLEILRQYGSRPGAAGLLIKAAVVVAALAWALLLRSQMGILLVALIALFYFLEGKKGWTLAAGLVLTLIQFPAPFGMLFAYWYDGQKGNAPRKLFYALYPAQLLACALVAALV